MICDHLSINAQRTGALSECIKCRMPIIFDGARWVWQYSLDQRKVELLRRAFAARVDSVRRAL